MFVWALFWSVINDEDEQVLDGGNDIRENEQDLDEDDEKEQVLDG